ASGGPQEGELSPILRLDPLTLEVGDLLVTAGDEIFPRALVVGTITDRKLPLAANRIEAPEDPRRAREVLVLVPPRLTAER
ncbi:MAG: hypothetical protein ACE5GW_14385, partial [Planctomycetota bacterium]